LTPEEEQAVCRSKVVYDTAAAAHDVRRRLGKKKRRREVYVYKCRCCNGYHVAKVPRPVRRDE
jgi:hypothetical protein